MDRLIKIAIYVDTKNFGKRFFHILRYIRTYKNFFLRNALYCENKAKQNRVFASVTSKIRCANFPARAERVEFSRKRQVCLNINFARKEGETCSQARAVKAIAKSRVYFIV